MSRKVLVLFKCYTMYRTVSTCYTMYQTVITYYTTYQTVFTYYTMSLTVFTYYTMSLTVFTYYTMSLTVFAWCVGPAAITSRLTKHGFGFWLGMRRLDTQPDLWGWADNSRNLLYNWGKDQPDTYSVGAPVSVTLLTWNVSSSNTWETNTKTTPSTNHVFTLLGLVIIIPSYRYAHASTYTAPKEGAYLCTLCLWRIII